MRLSLSFSEYNTKCLFLASPTLMTLVVSHGCPSPNHCGGSTVDSPGMKPSLAPLSLRLSRSLPKLTPGQVVSPGHVAATGAGILNGCCSTGHPLLHFTPMFLPQSLCSHPSSHCIVFILVSYTASQR